MSNIKFKIIPDKVSDFIDKISDLTNISDSIKLKIDNENILMYSTLGGNVLLAFKNYVIKTKEYFDIQDIEYTIDLVIVNAGRFVKNLTFLKSSSSIVMDVSYKQSPDDENIMNARAIKITGGKLKINWVGGEQYEMRDITKTQLDQRLDLKNRKWSFSICKADFLDIKKLSTINSNKIISVLINNGDIILSEPGAWEMEVDKTDKDRKTDLIISKKFLPCIEEMENIEFNIFENFMLIKSEDTNLMLSFEQSVDE